MVLLQEAELGYMWSMLIFLVAVSILNLILLLYFLFYERVPGWLALRGRPRAEGGVPSAAELGEIRDMLGRVLEKVGSLAGVEEQSKRFESEVRRLKAQNLKLKRLLLQARKQLKSLGAKGKGSKGRSR